LHVVSIMFISTWSLLAWLSFICTPLESIPQTYIHPPPVYSLLSLCFACCVLFYLFCGLDWPMECVSMLIFLWQTMHVSHYLPLLFLYHNTQSPFPCYLYQHEYLINHEFQFNVSCHYFLDVPSSLLVVHCY
jgi:hypothetical protein